MLNFNENISKKPLVSIIIPTYNRGKYIDKAINSVKNQTYSNFEIIVIDDGSTDNTKEIIDQFEGIIYLKQTNQGSASARNKGLSIAKGEFICTLDSDDYWEDTFLESCISILISQHSDFVFANWINYKKNGDFSLYLNNRINLKKYFHSHEFESKTWVHFEYDEFRKIILNDCIAPSSSLVFRKSSIVSLWDTNVQVADDWEFILGIVFSKKCNISFCKLPLWRKYEIGDNMFDSLEYSEMVKTVIIKDVNYIVNKYKNYYSQNELKQILNMQTSFSLWASFNCFKKMKFILFLQMIYLSFQIDSRFTFKKLFNFKHLNFYP